MGIVVILSMVYMLCTTGYIVYFSMGVFERADISFLKFLFVFPQFPSELFIFFIGSFQLYQFWRFKKNMQEALFNNDTAVFNLSFLNLWRGLAWSTVCLVLQTVFVWFLILSHSNTW